MPGLRGTSHRCIHDELHPRVAVRPQRYAELSDRDHEHHALADDRRALATDADDWQPLRIAVDYSSIDNATTLATIQDLVPYATSKLASANGSAGLLLRSRATKEES